MLSRTAESLFWLARYTERAGNVARGLAVTLRMAGMSAGLGPANVEWRALLVATGGEAPFLKQHDTPTQEAMVDWLVHDPGNPSSIVASIEAARRNGRAVRTALTVDMWEALNDTWNRLRELLPDAHEGEALANFLSWTRERVLLFNGAANDTMLRGEEWRFVQLGTMLERADNTARLLDVKHHLLEPSQSQSQSSDGQSQSQSQSQTSLALGGETGGSTMDYIRWQAILRSVSALRAYQRLYRDRLEPRRIAELLILRPELPRSLMACLADVSAMLEAIANGQGGRRGECHRLAGELHARLRFGRIEPILGDGLHEFLTEMIDQVAVLGAEIERFYIRA
jgi:uncharacterized alpha-E superfamily protein